MRKVLLLSPDHNFSDKKKKRERQRGCNLPSITELVSGGAHVLNHDATRSDDSWLQKL